jgi:hypothetical protein
MKQLVIAAALVALSFITASAQRATKAENDAAMKAGRQTFTAKTATFETDIRNHNYQAAETLAGEMLTLMRKGMSQIQIEAQFEQGAVQKATFEHYNDVERTVHNFDELSRNVTANSKELAKLAKTFITQY